MCHITLFILIAHGIRPLNNQFWICIRILTNKFYDFFLNWQTEKEMFWPIRSLFSFSTAETEKYLRKKLVNFIFFRKFYGTYLVGNTTHNINFGKDHVVFWRMAQNLQVVLNETRCGKYLLDDLLKSTHALKFASLITSKLANHVWLL